MTQISIGAINVSEQQPIINHQVVCVLGMHRSGTSLTSNILNLLGFSLGPHEHQMVATEFNPKGYGEHQLLTNLND